MGEADVTTAVLSLGAGGTHPPGTGQKSSFGAVVASVDLISWVQQR